MLLRTVSILRPLIILLTASGTFAASAAEPADSASITVSPPAEGRHNVCGIVRDSNGDALIGAAVSVRQDARLSAITDIDGRFCIANAPEECDLTVSYVNFASQHVKVTPDKDEYAITLQERSQQLEEVVVVGYASQRKVDLTGSVSSIGSKALADRPVTNATNALAGLAPGLTVTNSGGTTPGYEAQTITVRGTGTLNNAAPLVVVDGMAGV